MIGAPSPFVPTIKKCKGLIMTLASTFQSLENFFYTFSKSSFTFRVITFPPSKQFEGISFTCLSKKKVTFKLSAKKKTNEKNPIPDTFGGILMVKLRDQ